MPHGGTRCGLGPHGVADHDMIVARFAQEHWMWVGADVFVAVSIHFVEHLLDFRLRKADMVPLPHIEDEPRNEFVPIRSEVEIFVIIVVMSPTCDNFALSDRFDVGRYENAYDCSNNIDEKSF